MTYVYIMIYALDCEKCLQRDSLVKKNCTVWAMDESGMFCLFGDETKFKCKLKFSQLSKC